MNRRDFLSSDGEKAVVAAIKEAELNTSGEIRVHVEDKCAIDVLDRALKVFGKLNMHKTELRNGVLFFVAVKDQKFAVIGDEGINKVVPDNFWDEIKNNMAARFKQGEYSKGLAEGISQAGMQLKSHFPYQSDDINELPDEISYGE